MSQSMDYKDYDGLQKSDIIKLDCADYNKVYTGKSVRLRETRII